MSRLIVHAGDYTIEARFVGEPAPKTCAAVDMVVPFESPAIHVRRSGDLKGYGRTPPDLHWPGWAAALMRFLACILHRDRLWGCRRSRRSPGTGTPTLAANATNIG